MSKERTSYLLTQYLSGEISELESHELMELLLEERTSGTLQDALETIIGQSPASAEYHAADWEPLYSRILGENAGTIGRTPGRASVVRLFRWRKWYAAAAVFILLAGASGILLFKNTKRREIARAAILEQKSREDIGPGGNKAMLTLSDGSTMDLDEAKTGLLGQQGNSRLIKQNGGQLVYQSAKDRQPAALARVIRKHGGPDPQYNLLVTPRGGQYQVVLPDGSKVWLNAASSLRYPTNFTGKERRVELTGEAYFEVSAQVMPFIVHVNFSGRATPGVPSPAAGKAMDVQVLGTHFNIMAYSDEQTINTTLLEGAIKVRTPERSTLVRPGEQASLDRTDNKEIKLSPADVEETMAWKNGLFRFREATIEEVMRQVARWYDVEVIYTNGAPKDLFGGEMYRNVNVSKVLKVLEASGLHFTVQGKKILVQS